MTKKEKILEQYAKDLIVPNMADLTEQEKPYIRDFLNIKKDHLKITYEKIAEDAGISVSTAKRILKPSDDSAGCNIYTGCAIAKCLDFSLDAYCGISPQKTADTHELEKAEIKIEALKDKVALVENVSANKDYCIVGIIIALMFALIDLFVPTIGLTAGSYILGVIFIVVAIVYVVGVLLIMKRKG